MSKQKGQPSRIRYHKPKPQPIIKLTSYEQHFADECARQAWCGGEDTPDDGTGMTEVYLKSLGVIK